MPTYRSRLESRFAQLDARPAIGWRWSRTFVNACPQTTNGYEISASFRLRAEAASFRQTGS